MIFEKKELDLMVSKLISFLSAIVVPYFIKYFVILLACSFNRKWRCTNAEQLPIVPNVSHVAFIFQNTHNVQCLVVIT